MENRQDVSRVRQIDVLGRVPLVRRDSSYSFGAIRDGVATATGRCFHVRAGPIPAGRRGPCTDLYTTHGNPPSAIRHFELLSLARIILVDPISCVFFRQS